MVIIHKIIFLTVATSLAACTHTPITVIDSSEPIDAGRYKKIGSSKGESCYFKIFGLFPTSKKDPSLEEAIVEAKDVHDGTDALIQITVDEYMKHWLFISKHCTTVNAISIRIR